MKSGYISIIGPPNSGKSTLLNRIVGEELSIVTPKAQTTRRRVVGIHNMPGAQMIFLDTPGIHESTKQLNRYMMEVVDAAVRDADVICYVVDGKGDGGSQMAGGGADVKDVVSALRGRHGVAMDGGDTGRYLVALNKLDLILGRPWEEVVDEFREAHEGVEVIGISAKTGFGVDELINKLVEKLPEGHPLYPDDIYTEHPVRFLVSEIIREQVLNLMHQELPYSIAVQVEDYKEEPDIHRIDAAVIVEKESQKPMVIGKGGAMIKKIGKLSRAKIESLVGCKVFLKLFVKVEKNWTKDKRAIRELFTG